MTMMPASWHDTSAYDESMHGAKHQHPAQELFLELSVLITAGQNENVLASPQKRVSLV